MVRHTGGCPPGNRYQIGADGADQSRPSVLVTMLQGQLGTYLHTQLTNLLISCSRTNFVSQTIDRFCAEIWMNEVHENGHAPALTFAMPPRDDCQTHILCTVRA